MAMAAALGFRRGDRILVQKSKNNQMNHAETYMVGEHGSIVEVQDSSSVVRVRLDGFEGKHGNYHRVESVLPLVRRPVQHRYVNASVLHLKKQNEAKKGDYIVFELADMAELLGQVTEIVEDMGPCGEMLLEVQPYEVDRSESYGPLGRRPWGPVGDRRHLPASAARCFVHLDGGTYLRACDVEELREKALLTSMDQVEVRSSTAPQRLDWPAGAPQPRVRPLTQ
mmetsp:Transcript_55068/g.160716  ORF Transcript_55068/g.160716 Transcript_55068/m.160716 type:complete len:225 (+) Transcript_55068:38-712(+)